MAEGPRCRWCGSDEVDGEHVFSKWVGRNLGRGRFVGKLASVHASFTPDRPSEFLGPVDLPSDGPIDDLVVYDQCKSCNSGWMNQIEIRARDLLIPIMAGKATRLTADEQQRVATWVSLKAIVAEATRPGNSVIPRAAADELYRTKPRRPPRAFEVGMAAIDQRHSTGYFHNVARSGDTPWMVLTTFVLGHLVLQCFVPVEPQLGQITDMGDGHWISQLWPTKPRPFAWPPPSILTETGALAASTAYPMITGSNGTDVGKSTIRLLYLSEEALANLGIGRLTAPSTRLETS